MSEGWLAVAGSAVGGLLALGAQWLAGRQQKQEWKTEAKRMRAQRELDSLGELAEALAQATSALTTEMSSADMDSWRSHCIARATRLNDASIRAAIYLPEEMLVQVPPLLDSCRRAIESRIVSFQNRSEELSEQFVAYIHRTDEFHSGLKRLLLPEPPTRDQSE